MRKVILYIATSLDGFIARENGDLDWLPGASGDNDSSGDDCGFQEFLDSVDTVLMGHKTYKQILSFGIDYPYKGKNSFVFTRTAQPRDENAEFISGDTTTFVKHLKSTPGGDIWLNGGAQLFGTLYEKALVDELILFIIPVTLGKGIPLFPQKPVDTKLKLLNSHSYSGGVTDGIVKLHYQVQG